MFYLIFKVAPESVSKIHSNSPTSATLADTPIQRTHSATDFYRDTGKMADISLMAYPM